MTEEDIFYTKVVNLALVINKMLKYHDPEISKLSLMACTGWLAFKQRTSPEELRHLLEQAIENNKEQADAHRFH